jgi:vancomycin aglycone glucosyltransferase
MESFGLVCIPIGPDLKPRAGATARAPLGKPTPEQWRQLASQTIRSQFSVLTEAARDCDVVVAMGALQFATRSVAEAMQIPYLFATYCPMVLPSPEHPPPKIGMHYSQSLGAQTNDSLWTQEEQYWNDLFRPALNEERAKLGLCAIDNIQRHVFTDRPWLAAEPLIAPAGASDKLRIVQTGAWSLPDESELPVDLLRFLDAGEPPIYVGFGSVRAAQDAGRVLLESARALNLRVVLSQGWSHLHPSDAGADCISVGDVNHDRLFERVAAVIHHGGAGTTTTAARAGKAQIIVPHNYDQYYWAKRVSELGVGISGPISTELSVDAMIDALRGLRPEMTERARDLAARMDRHGVRKAARLLGEVVSG